jgi:ActR/RegA family two-component response regulator
MFKKLFAPFRPPSAKEIAASVPPFCGDEPKRLLLLEDDTNFCLLLYNFTEKFSVEVTQTDTIKEAVTITNEAERPFNCMVLDVRLINGIGIDFYRSVAQRWPATSVVFLTGFYDEELVKQVEAIGPARVYSKDRVADPQFLLQMLSQLGLKRVMQ